MLKTLLCAAALLVAGETPAAVAPDEDARERAAAALEKAEARLAEARQMAEKARAEAAKLRETELAKVRDSLKAARVKLPDEAMEAIEKALAGTAEGLSVITLDASGLATVKADAAGGKDAGGTEEGLRFRYRVAVGPDGALTVDKEGDGAEVAAWFADAKAKGKDAKVEKEVRVETKAFTIGPDGELKEMDVSADRLPKVLGLRLDAEGKLPANARVLLRQLEGDSLPRFPLKDLRGDRDDLLGELKKLNKRLDAIEARLDKIEKD